ncbi:anaerobic ribonucleoside-triphosphate reductase [Shigella flexneri]
MEDVWDYSYQHVPYYGSIHRLMSATSVALPVSSSAPARASLAQCGNHDASRVSVTRRVCGYLGSPDARPFNAGKQEEVKRRVKHLGNGQIG